jgi:hypothetical protein
MIGRNMARRKSTPVSHVNLVAKLDWSRDFPDCKMANFDMLLERVQKLELSMARRSIAYPIASMNPKHGRPHAISASSRKVIEQGHNRL